MAWFYKVKGLRKCGLCQTESNCASLDSYYGLLMDNYWNG